MILTCFRWKKLYWLKTGRRGSYGTFAKWTWLQISRRMRCPRSRGTFNFDIFCQQEHTNKSAELLKLERVRSPSIQSFQSSIHHSPFTIHTIRHPHSSDHHPDITSSIHGILQQAIIESSSKGIIGVRLPSHIPPSAGKRSVPPNTWNPWKSMQIHENPLKSMKINENLYKSMKINENHWKSMKIN